jgi:hypothetical protein
MYLKKEISIFFYNKYICFKSLYAHDMVICFSAGFSYSVLMWPRFAVLTANVNYIFPKQNYNALYGIRIFCTVLNATIQLSA